MKILVVAAALALAACASDERQPETRRTTAEFNHDAVLTAKVKSAIATDVGDTAIDIETFRGVVQLGGFAGSRDQAARAAAAAKDVEGVRSVKSDVRIKSGS